MEGRATCVKSQLDSRTLQLVIDRGSRWRDVFLVMFRVYIDDSGTDPNQQVAIASALIMPAGRIVALDKEWERLTKKEGFTDFHMSLCAARNEKSQFGGWDEVKQKRVISRVREIGKKFGVKALSLAVNKIDYDTIVLPKFDFADKFHYTWAIRHVIDLIDKWALPRTKLPLEYVYDWMDSKTQPEAKAEIETVMEQAEEEAVEAGMAGRYTNYSFRRRKDIPALQCADALAWTCYRFALYAHIGTPPSQLALDCFADYSKHLNRQWLYAAGMSKEDLQDWAEKEQQDGTSRQRAADWQARKSERH